MIGKLSRIFIIVLVCTGLPVTPTVVAGEKITPTILVLGDSLSAAWGIDRHVGWVAMLQTRLNKNGYRYRVVNASVSGDTTRTGLSRLDQALKTHQPEIIIVALGANDGLRGLSFGEIESSLGQIIQRSQDKGVKVLITGVRLPPNYGPAYNQQFAQVFRQLARRYRVPLVPQMLNQVSDYRELLQEDGMHPTAQAQPQIVDNIWRKLEPLLVKR
jgi:acyl-CoA thioesterase-1